MYRFAGRPLWILSHLFVLACVLVFVRLGVWQLQRLDERRALNVTLEANVTRAPAPIDDVLPDAAASTPAQVEAARGTRVVVTGTYRTDDQVFIRNRSYGGNPGWWVLTPLETASGLVAVNRGWVPFQAEPGAPPPEIAPPSGPVTVVGWVRVTRPWAGATDVAPETPDRRLTLGDVDVDLLDDQVEGELAPLSLDLIAQDPAQTSGVPIPVEAPPLDEGPHFSYAMQWFIFASLTVVVYVLILRKVARRHGAGIELDATETPGDARELIDR